MYTVKTIIVANEVVLHTVIDEEEKVLHVFQESLKKEAEDLVYVLNRVEQANRKGFLMPCNSCVIH